MICGSQERIPCESEAVALLSLDTTSHFSNEANRAKIFFFAR
jgi:hypothetical protein